MSGVYAKAGNAQTYPYTDLPKVVTLEGAGVDDQNSPITVTEYKWYRLARPSGSSMALSADNVAGPTFTADRAGTYLLFLTVKDNNGVWSERNPLKAPDAAFVAVTARTQSLNLTLPATGQRNHGDALNAILTTLETNVGASAAHLDGGTGKHNDSQIVYTRADGSRKNIGANDDDVRKALDKLDDTIAALSSLATTDKTSVVAAINEVNTAAVAAKAAVDAAVSTSAGAGDSGKLIKLNGSGTITDSVHGNRGGGSLHAVAIAGGAAGFMSGADKTKLDGIEAGAQVVTEARVLTALAASGAPKDVGGGKIINCAQPTSPSEVVALSQDGLIDPKFLQNAAQSQAIRNGSTIAVNDIVEWYVGARVQTAPGSSRHPCGIAITGGTGDVGGSVNCLYKDRGIVALTVVNGGATVIGQRVIVSATPNQIDDAGANVISGTLGVALDTVTGNGTSTCRVYLQPVGGQ